MEFYIIIDRKYKPYGSGLYTNQEEAVEIVFQEYLSELLSVGEPNYIIEQYIDIKKDNGKFVDVPDDEIYELVLSLIKKVSSLGGADREHAMSESSFFKWLKKRFWAEVIVDHGYGPTDSDGYFDMDTGNKYFVITKRIIK